MSPTKEKVPDHIGFFLVSPFSKLEGGNKNLDYYLKAAKYIESNINSKNGIAGLPIKIHIHTERPDENISNKEFLNYLKDENIHFILSRPYGLDNSLFNNEDYIFFRDLYTHDQSNEEEEIERINSWNRFNIDPTTKRGWRAELSSLFPDKELILICNGSFRGEDYKKSNTLSEIRKEYINQNDAFMDEFGIKTRYFDNLHTSQAEFKKYLGEINKDQYLIICYRIHPIDAQPSEIITSNLGIETKIGEVSQEEMDLYYMNLYKVFTSSKSEGNIITFSLTKDEAYDALNNPEALTRKNILSLAPATHQSYIRLQDFFNDIDPEMPEWNYRHVSKYFTTIDQINLIKHIFKGDEYKYISRSSFLKEASKRLQNVNGVDDLFIGDSLTIQFDSKKRNLFTNSKMFEFRRNSPISDIIDISLYKRQLGLDPEDSSKISILHTSYVNIDVINIHNISIEDGTFNAKFYFELTTPFRGGIDIITFKNSTLDSQSSIREIYQSNIDEEYTHFKYIIEDKFQFDAVADNYPFDEQIIYFSFCTINEEKYGVLQPIQEHDVDKEFQIDGWSLKDTFSGIYREKIYRKSVIAAPTIQEGNTNKIGWFIKRESSMTMLKILIPLSFLWSLVIYGTFLPLENLDRSVAVITTSFLSAIALYFSTERPQPLKMTVIDYVFASFYLTVGLASTSIFTLNFFPSLYEQYMPVVKYALPLSLIAIFILITKRIQSKRFKPKLIDK